MGRKIVLILCGIAICIFSCNAIGDSLNTVVVAVPGDTKDSFESIFRWDGIGASLIFSSLLAYDNKFSVINDLAQGYSVSPDGRTWEVHLRFNIQFDDGSELSATDVVYSFMMAKRIPGWLDLSMLERASAPDANTVIFTLNRPDMSFIHALASLGILKKDSLFESTEHGPVGSGPYKLVANNESREIVIEANSYYYGKKPDIERMVFLEADEEASIRFAGEGKADVIPVPVSGSTQIIEGSRLVSIGSVEKTGILFPLEPKSVGIDNSVTGNDVTSQKSIREAIDRAINRDNIAAGILGGNGSPVYGPADGFPWDEPGGRQVAGRVRNAKTILAQDGWQDLNSDGILEKNGIMAEFSLLYPKDDIIAESIAIAVANAALEAGIKINTQGKTKDELKLLMHSNAVIFSWGSQDLFEIYRLYHSSNTASNNYPNHYHNTVVDGYLDKAKQSSSYADAVQYLRKAQWDGRTGLSMKGDAPIVWLVSRAHTYFVNDRISVDNSRLEKRGFGWPVLESMRSWSLEK